MEKRKHVRYPLVGNLPEVRFEKTSLHLLSVDVSQDGLGVTSSEPLPTGARLTAVFAETEVTLTLVWSKAMTGGLSGDIVYRCGLSCKDIMAMIEKMPQLMVCKDL